MYKRIFIFLFLACVTQSFSQEKNKVNINLGFQGLESSIDMKLYEAFHLELFGGIGAGYNVKKIDGYALNFDFVPFTKGALKWYFINKERTRHYVSIQSKYSFGETSDYSVNKALLSEVNWGIEKNLGKRLIVNGHLGYGHIKDFDTEYSDNLLTIGLTLKYNILKF